MKRVVLFHYEEEEDIIYMRHYLIQIKALETEQVSSNPSAINPLLKVLNLKKEKVLFKELKKAKSVDDFILKQVKRM